MVQGLTIDEKDRTHKTFSAVCITLLLNLRTKAADNGGMRANLFATLLVLFFTVFNNVAAQDLSITQGDLILTQGADGGFHLFIRKKPAIMSVMLTETTSDPSHQEDNYSYRTAEWNTINGDEVRILNGVAIPRSDNIFSLIDSTPEYVEQLGGMAFHIYIPYLIYYGYADRRHGEVYVGDGTYLNIRAFGAPYGDYRGGYYDNPFTLEITQTPLTGQPENNFMKEAEDAYKEITDKTGGVLMHSTGPENIVDTIRRMLQGQIGSALDLVFCIDTTASMQNDIDAIREQLTSVLSELINYKNVRVGFVIYRDYLDEYLTRTYSFNSKMNEIQRTLNSFRARGGRDIPEAVYEALYEAETKFSWQAPGRQIILIGDAPPHPRPRDRITKDMSINKALEKKITINAIILPQ